MKILIAEDEQRSREGLERLLANIEGDHRVIAHATNGQIALDLALKYHPDVIFADIKMPVMDGLTLAKMVRTYKLKTEIVIISAYADFEFARQAIDIGVCEYILKPVTTRDLEKVLGKLHEKLNLEGDGYSQNGMSLKAQYPNAHPIVVSALEIIETGYASKINQRQMASELGVSPEYFSYIFSKNTGKTFSNFLRDYRMDQAKRLLREGKHRTKEVPYMVGYSDEKYFYQVFKKTTGISPAEYQRQMGVKVHNYP